jgi:SAM-dependent methyltransferase
VPEHRDRERLRGTFGSVAELYDRARPTYPAAVFDDLAELAHLEPGSRVLEIGPGTGKATAELASRGYAVTGIELSTELAELARRNAPRAQIDVGDFEQWEPSETGFDAVVAFTAFHWIAPDVRYAKTSRLLRPGGALAVVAGVHVLPPDGDAFFAEVQEDYDAVVPHPDNGPPRPPEEVESPWADEFRDSSLFEDVEAGTCTRSATPPTSTSRCSARSRTTSRSPRPGERSSSAASTSASPPARAEPSRSTTCSC